MVRKKQAAQQVKAVSEKLILLQKLHHLHLLFFIHS